jgi:hypothetical protein
MLNHAQRQGDQIGRIFAHWAILYSGQFPVNESSPGCLKIDANEFAQKWIGLHFGRFFHNRIWSP